jgi:hypothetical protein
MQCSFQHFTHCELASLADVYELTVAFDEQIKSIGLQLFAYEGMLLISHTSRVVSEIVNCHSHFGHGHRVLTTDGSQYM